MVSPYPPVRDGIAAYAVQSVARLRAEGHEVRVLSPGPTAAHEHLALVGPRGALALAKRVRAYDRVVVQFHPDVFYPLPPTSGAWTVESLALLAAFRAAREVHVVVHEIDYRQGRRRGAEGIAARALWRSVDRVVVHTARERDDFVAAFGVDPARVELAPHGGDFVRRTAHDRAGARRSLGLPADAHLFLAIGFLQRHKGFDRAARAFAGLGDAGARLAMVGSARLDDVETAAHVEELEQLAAQVPGVELHVGYLSDELFDRWLVAADSVVLPYRSIWSSGVLERAGLYDRDVIATDVGGLAEQVGGREGVTLVEDDAGLAAAMRAAVGARVPAPVREPWAVPEGAGLRAAVQDEVRRRAATRRSTSPAAGRAAASRRVSRATVPLRRLPPLGPPQTASRSVVAAAVKQVVRRLTAWQVDPLVRQVNALQSAATRAVEAAAEQGPDPDR